MRVVAFSCLHLATRITQVQLQDHEYNYRRAEDMFTYCQRTQPDLVINLGDFSEPYYDTLEQVEMMERFIVPTFRQLPYLNLGGNHDRLHDYPTHYEIDGVRYEHGHQLIGSRGDISREEYVAEVRKATSNLDFKLVHGHTHYPSLKYEEGKAFDVGSITFSGTFGEIIDGEVFKLLRM